MGWEFLFLGANIDAFAEGARLGVKRSRCCKIAEDRVGTRMAYRDVGKFVSRSMKCRDMSELEDSWRECSAQYEESRELTIEELELNS